ncbi:MAG: trypsin-like peptidase domain-containing protein [Deltaproteobacteria bacterium]|nr:trypsin-like peptidase domain-containing protein [Deltaproteobacteria bacterium]
MRALAAILLLLLTAAPVGAAEDARWEATVERAARSVVVLRVAANRPFDTESSSFSVATGFVVDAERGIILTNRHVVHPGPVTADAVFLNHEEVRIWPIYRDPVHDFGFFRFDPDDVRFMDVAALPLAPEAARVGTDIRVIGNDAGEKLSILDGTLARLDRPAPVYGRGRYNDFNTFYYQAASSSSGGSSGSPVIDRAGRVIALNAGGSRAAASSFFLPLDRVVRALSAIQAGEPVARGTLETVFVHEPYDELRRLGLAANTEAALRKRFPEGTGQLVVREIVPGSAADSVLELGDILVGLEGRPVADFVSLEEVTDGAVGRNVQVSVERGGEHLDLELSVQDLHAITPDAYLEVGGAVLHPLSYQLARGFGVPLSGVYLASRGYAFTRAGVPGRAVLTEVAGEPVSELESLERKLAGLADGERFQVRYFSLAASRTPSLAVVTMDRKWFSMRHCRRDDAAGRFQCRESAAPPAPGPLRPATASLETSGSFAARLAARSLVLVNFDVPYAVDGVQGRAFSGAGLVVDADRGLVAVDRDTVPVTLGDVRLTFGGSVEVPGVVVGFHPAHNLALVRYDPLLLGDTPVRSARLRDVELEAGDAVTFVAMTNRQQVLSVRTQVSRVDPPTVPIPIAPRFRETNSELIVVAERVPSIGGVLTDRWGRVLAFWASFSTQNRGEVSSFFAGLPSHHLIDLIRPLQRGEPLAWRSLGVELLQAPLARARSMGLSDEDAERLSRHDPSSRRVLGVARVAHGTPAAELLRPGDLILAAGGEPVTRFRELESAARGEAVDLSILRRGKRLDLHVQTTSRATSGTRRALLWAGALLQDPPEELAWQRGLPRSGVYVAGRWHGSPADRYGVTATLRIVAVDGVPVAGLDAFLEAVAGKAEGDSVRLRTVDLQGKQSVRTLELDGGHWPLEELRWEEGGWHRRRLAPEGSDRLRLPSVAAEFRHSK